MFLVASKRAADTALIFAQNLNFPIDSILFRRFCHICIMNSVLNLLDAAIESVILLVIMQQLQILLINLKFLLIMCLTCGFVSLLILFVGTKLRTKNKQNSNTKTSNIPKCHKKKYIDREKVG
jgi:hypothetical protein